MNTSEDLPDFSCWRSEFILFFIIIFIIHLEKPDNQFHNNVLFHWYKYRNAVKSVHAFRVFVEEPLIW